MRINEVLKGKPSEGVVTIAPDASCASWCPCWPSTTWVR